MGETETVGIFGWKGRILLVHSPSMLECYYGFVRFYIWHWRVLINCANDGISWMMFSLLMNSWTPDRNKRRVESSVTRLREGL